MKRRFSGAIALSVLGHSGLMVAIHVVPSAARVPPLHEVEIQIADLGELAAERRVALAFGKTEPDFQPSSTARPRIPRPDSERGGAEGGETSPEPAVNLSAHRDPLTRRANSPLLTPVDQSQRLVTGKHRRSYDDRRATPNPMSLTLVVSGSGFVPMRLPTGSYRAPAETNLRGGSIDVAALDSGAISIDRGLAAEAGAGQAARAIRESRRAHIAWARPAVPARRAAVSSRDRAQPQDRTDSALQVSNAIASLISTSTAGGAPGPGAGGVMRRGPIGTAGDLRGVSSRPSGSGTENHSDAIALGLGASYFDRILRHLDPYWENAFPLEATARGRSGVAQVAMILERDGAVSRIRVVRPSGVPTFDRNLTEAVARAAPYPPIPPALGSGPIAFTITFDALNAAVALPYR